MTLLDHHARELSEGSGIDPGVVAARGCFSATADQVRALGFAPAQCRSGLIFPQWTLAGAQVGNLLKPDDPRTDDAGKVLKYEAPTGSTPHFDVHPHARAAMLDPAQTLYFGEGNKKGDSLWSRGKPCVSITGVWMFLNGRLVVPDLDEIPLSGRLVRVVFDSDVTRKLAVAEALLRFCAALHRRGARVEVIYLPEGADGAKVGVDDFFVARGMVAGLEALARPWRPDDGPGVWLRDSTESDVATLRRELAMARADTSAVVQVILNPDLTKTQLITAVAVASETRAKLARGEVEANGKVILSASEIADDWRPKPETGERVALVNPSSGQRPRMARERVGALMTEGVDRGLIAARPIMVTREHANGRRWQATDWVVDPVSSMAAALKPWAGFGQPKERKPRTAPDPCPACGEFHAIRHDDICTGCGVVTRERITAAPSDVSKTLSSDNLSEERRVDSSGPVNRTSVKPSPPGPYLYTSDKLSEEKPMDSSGVVRNGHDPGASIPATRLDRVQESVPAGEAGNDRWTS